MDFYKNWEDLGSGWYLVPNKYNQSVHSIYEKGSGKLIGIPRKYHKVCPNLKIARKGDCKAVDRQIQIGSRPLYTYIMEAIREFENVNREFENVNKCKWHIRPIKSIKFDKCKNQNNGLDPIHGEYSAICSQINKSLEDNFIQKSRDAIRLQLVSWMREWPTCPNGNVDISHCMFPSGTVEFHWDCTCSYQKKDIENDF